MRTTAHSALASDWYLLELWEAQNAAQREQQKRLDELWRAWTTGERSGWCALNLTQ